MQTVVVPDQPAPAPLIETAAARARLGLSAGVSDDTIMAFIAAATVVLDGPNGWLGRSLARQQLELQVDGFPACDDLGFKLLCPPVISIDSIAYTDAVGATQTLPSSAYALSGRRVSPAYGTCWPSARCAPGSVRIRYTAGYETGKVPAPIIQAIVLQVAAMNAMTKADPSLTSETIPGVYSRSWSSGDTGGAYDKAAQSLLATYRVIDG